MATGAGGALVKNQKIIRGRFNFEPGHHIIALNGLKVPGKTPGSFESYLAGSAIEHIKHRKPEELPDRYFANQIDRLSQILVNVALFWSPEIIVLNGPVAKRYGSFLPSIRRKMKEMIQVFPVPQLTISALDENAALLGGFSQKF